jgi:hypothetical protein
MPQNHDDTLGTDGAAVLAEHAAACDECRAAPLPLAAVERELAGYRVPLDVAALSRRVLAAVRPELQRLASVWFWRRLARVTAAALLPLPLIVLLNGWLLGLAYGWVSQLVPPALALYLVASYAAAQILLLALTYAAIPLLLAREAWNRVAAPAEVLS